MEFAFDIPWKVNINCAVLVTPFHFETTVLRASPISDDFSLSAKYRQEVLGVLFSFIFDYKVVNYKSESYGAPFVCEQTRCVLGFMVA